MAMELEGRIARKLNVQTGTSARGSWSKQEFVLEYQEGNFPSQVCMNVWGEDKVKELDKYQVGDKVKISFNLSSREYNGRWYTDVRAWRIEPAGVASQSDYVASAGNYGAPTGVQHGTAHIQNDQYAVSAGSYSTPAAEHSAPMPSADDMSSPISDDDLPF